MKLGKIMSVALLAATLVAPVSSARAEPGVNVIATAVPYSVGGQPAKKHYIFTCTAIAGGVTSSTRVVYCYLYYNGTVAALQFTGGGGHNASNLPGNVATVVKQTTQDALPWQVCWRVEVEHLGGGRTVYPRHPGGNPPNGPPGPQYGDGCGTRFNA